MKHIDLDHHALGKRGEAMAIDHLMAQGFSVLAQNKRIGRAEIDIIAKRKGLLLFVEVKLRSSEAFGPPESFITPVQEALYHEAATVYLEETGWEGAIRFDIVAVEKNRYQIILHHFEDAF